MSGRILLGPGDQERDISGTLPCVTAGCPQDDLLFQTMLAMQSRAGRPSNNGVQTAGASRGKKKTKPYLTLYTKTSVRWKVGKSMKGEERDIQDITEYLHGLQVRKYMFYFKTS